MPILYISTLSECQSELFPASLQGVSSLLSRVPGSGPGLGWPLKSVGVKVSRLGIPSAQEPIPDRTCAGTSRADGP